MCKHYYVLSVFDLTDLAQYATSSKVGSGACTFSSADWAKWFRKSSNVMLALIYFMAPRSHYLACKPLIPMTHKKSLWFQVRNPSGNLKQMPQDAIHPFHAKA